MLRSLLLPVLAGLLAFSSPLVAQWSSDNSAPLELFPGVSNQEQARLARTEGGDLVCAWVDRRTQVPTVFNGASIRWQRFDPAGNEAFAPGGLELLSLEFNGSPSQGVRQVLRMTTIGESSYLAFKSTPESDTISLMRVDADGSRPWTGEFVDVGSAPGDMISDVELGVTGNGELFVAWSRTLADDLQFAIVATDGTVTTTGGQFLPTSFVTRLVGLAETSDGGIALLWLAQQTSSFLPSLATQKWDAAGVRQWAVPGMQFLVTNSVPLLGTNLRDRTPKIVADDSGGVFVSWSTSAVNDVDSWVHGVMGDGTFYVGAGGVLVTDNQDAYETQLFFDPVLGGPTLLWLTQSGPDNHSVRIQRYDSMGNPQFQFGGLSPYVGIFVPLEQMTAHRIDLGYRVFFSRSNNVTDGTLLGVEIRDNGMIVALPFPQPLSSDFDRYVDLVSINSALGDDVAAFGTFGAGSGSPLYIQNVQRDSEFGPQAGVLSRTGPGNLDTLTGMVGPLSPVAGSIDLAIDVAATGQPFGAFVSYLGRANIPLAGPNPPTLFLDLTSTLLFLEIQPGPLATTSIQLPNDLSFAGQSFRFQGAHGGGGQPLQLTNALDVYLGT